MSVLARAAVRILARIQNDMRRRATNCFPSRRIKIIGWDKRAHGKESKSVVKCGKEWIRFAKNNTFQKQYVSQRDRSHLWRDNRPAAMSHYVARAAICPCQISNLDRRVSSRVMYVLVQFRRGYSDSRSWFDMSGNIVKTKVNKQNKIELMYKTNTAFWLYLMRSALQMCHADIIHLFVSE